MKVTQTEIVYQDEVTGVTYTEEYTMMPVATLSDDGAPVRFGVLLRPYGFHPDIDWDDRSEPRDEAHLEKHGFLPNRHGQLIVVSEEMFKTRFKRLGKMSKELDLEALTRHYEEENCEFENKENLAKAVVRRLSEMGPGLWSCQLYAVLKGFLGTKKDAT